MKKESNLEYCSNCKSLVKENFCPECGRTKVLKRIDSKYIINEISNVLNFDKGILYTVKELLIRPGITTKKFIREDRSRLVKPVIFLIISSLIYSILRQILNFQDGHIYYDSLNPSTSTLIFEWVQSNYGYGNLIIGVFIAFWTKILFRKNGFNFYEILILLCFVMGIGTRILSFFGVIEGLTKLKFLDYGAMLFIIYTTCAIGQFFDGKKLIIYVKAFFSYIFGFASFPIVILLIGKLIDILV